MKFNDEKGAALVELALSVVLLVTLLFGMIEFGRVMYMRNSLNLAAREGARMASVSKTVSTSDVESQVKNFIPFDSTGLSVVVSSTPAGFTSGSTITVTASMPFQSVVPLLITQLNGLTLTGQASMRYEY
ncbi:MAG TPA: TadE/TadG family type IV pilus assembly protein [Geomonas sp.]|nr:TadE/TadG family type IV pilus assembly protein [Geomonas sp.]